MELIRTKRATTSGQNGGPGQPKSKYRKRSVSPVLSRALRSARCAGVSDLVADFFGLRIVLLIPTSLSRSLLARAPASSVSDRTMRHGTLEWIFDRWRRTDVSGAIGRFMLR